MAVKARAEITLSSIRDVQSVTRYYLLQSSTSAAPSKPTTNPPGGNWVTTEPTYTTGSTNSLYFTDCTVFSDGTFVYSDVSLSSSYEAAKVAYNKAENAETIAEKATHSINLIPFGSRSWDDTVYWKNGFVKDGYESAGFVCYCVQLEDGWIHVVIDGTNGTSSYLSDNTEVSICPSVKPGKLYTVLYEVRNNKTVYANTNNSYFYIVQTANSQFWGGNYTELLEGSGTNSTFTLRTMAPDSDGVFRKRFTKYADTEHGDPNKLWRMTFRAGKGDYVDYEVRVSLYEGRYLGDYMPYVVSDTTDLSAAILAAQATADGKNTVYYQASAPTGGTYKVSDIWFDTNDGNKMYMWNGTTWVAEQFGNAAISDLSITNAKIANATIQSAKIANLDAGKVTTGTMSAARIKGDTLTLGGENNVDGMLKVYDANGTLVGSFTREGLMAIAGTIGGWTIGATQLYNTYLEDDAIQHSAAFSPTDELQFSVSDNGTGTTMLDVHDRTAIYGSNGINFAVRTLDDEWYQSYVAPRGDDYGVRIGPALDVYGPLSSSSMKSSSLELQTNMGSYVRQPAMIMSGSTTISTGTSSKRATICTIPVEYQTGWRIIPFVTRTYGNSEATPADAGDFYYAYYNSADHKVCVKLANVLASGTAYTFDYMIYAVPLT